MSSKGSAGGGGRSGGRRQRNIAVLGYWNVGKTSVVQRYVNDAFTPKYFPTIEQTYHKELAFQASPFFNNLIFRFKPFCFCSLQKSLNDIVYDYF